MKNLPILLLSLITLLACEQKKDSGDSLESENQAVSMNDDIDSVKTLITGSFQEIWSDLDYTKIAPYNTDDFILLENGLVWNNAFHPALFAQRTEGKGKPTIPETESI